MNRACVGAARIGVVAWVGFCMLGGPVATVGARADDPTHATDAGRSVAAVRVPSTDTQVTDDAGAAMNIRLPPAPEEDRSAPIVAPQAKIEVVPESVSPLQEPPVAATTAAAEPTAAAADAPAVEPAVMTSAVAAVGNTDPAVEPEPETRDVTQIAPPVLTQVVPLAPRLAVPPAPTETPTAPPPPAPVMHPLAPDVVAGLLRRGDVLLSAGDVLSARLLYERAAAAGSAAGATGVAKTYDAVVLAAVGARGIRSDAERAATWYRKATALSGHNAPDMPPTGNARR